MKVFDKSTLSKSKLMTFRKEAQILASLSHQNIVTFVNVKESEGWLFLVMEYIQAETLKSFMEKNLIQERQAAGIVKQILLAIQYLHRLNIIHRDLKPCLYLTIYVRKHFNPQKRELQQQCTKGEDHRLWVECPDGTNRPFEHSIPMWDFTIHGSRNGASAQLQ